VHGSAAFVVSSQVLLLPYVQSCEASCAILPVLLALAQSACTRHAETHCQASFVQLAVASWHAAALYVLMPLNSLWQTAAGGMLNSSLPSTLAFNAFQSSMLGQQESPGKHLQLYRDPSHTSVDDELETPGSLAALAATAAVDKSKVQSAILIRVMAMNPCPTIRWP
jgi:hypothetical protein